MNFKKLDQHIFYIMEIEKYTADEGTTAAGSLSEPNDQVGAADQLPNTNYSVFLMFNKFQSLLLIKKKRSSAMSI